MFCGPLPLVCLTDMFPCARVGGQDNGMNWRKEEWGRRSLRCYGKWATSKGKDTVCVDIDEAPRIVNLRKTNCSIVGALGWAELVSNRSSFTEGQGNVL